MGKRRKTRTYRSKQIPRYKKVWFNVTLSSAPSGWCKELNPLASG